MHDLAQRFVFPVLGPHAQADVGLQTGMGRRKASTGRTSPLLAYELHSLSTSAVYHF